MNYQELMHAHPELFKKDNVPIRIVFDAQRIKDWQSARLEELRKNNQSVSWANLGVILDDPYYVVVRDLVQFSNGEMNGYNRILTTGGLAGGKSVVVLPRYREKLIVMKQYRHPTQSWEYEIPRGYAEPNTSPTRQARTEIFEEIQGKVKNLYSLGTINENSGAVAFPLSMYLAELAEVGKPNADESIKSLFFLSTEEIEKWILAGKINDSFTIAAYTRAKLKGLI